MTRLATIWLFLLAAGCGQPAVTTTNRTLRQPSDPVIPAHTKTDLFVGEWEAAGEPEFAIVREDDGDVVIRPPVTGVWESIVNNVRFEGDKLCFDRYLYYIGNTQFLTETGDHPMSGTRSQIELQLIPDSPNKLQCKVTSPSAREPGQVLLSRALD